SLREMTVNVDDDVMSSDPENAPAPKDDPRHVCVTCGRASRSVTRKTMLLMLKPEVFDQIGDGQYRFCSDPDCRVVYFTEGQGASFTTDDVRVRVGLKEKEAPIPVCYCFGFYEADIREEIAATGRTTIPQRITALLKEGMCACPARNPSGACCLGEVTKTVKRLYALNTKQAQISKSETQEKKK
ncbi:MAG: hypothetical protein AB1631_22195, partial [Acidobacteriota bacterium]